MSSEPNRSDAREEEQAPETPVEASAPVPADAAPPPEQPASGDGEARRDEAAPASDLQGQQAEPVSPEIDEPVLDEPEMDESQDEGPVTPAEPLEFIDETEEEEDLKFEWYILKVQVNREDSIKAALLRRVKMEGKEKYFREIVVPTEDMAEFTKTGKRRIVKKKIYPGYILVNMSINDETWFLVRETPGIGDFTGSAGKPTPMLPQDVDRILRTSKVIEDEAGQVRTAIPFKSGDRVRVKEGYFQNFEGDVDAIDQANGRVTVMINIFGRSTPVELEHWQIEKI